MSAVLSPLQGYPPRDACAVGLEEGLHELYGAHDHAACLSAVALMLAQAGGTGNLLWVRHAGQEREAGTPYPVGVRALGLDPDRIVILLVQDGLAGLQAALEGAQSTGLGAVVLELWGEAKAYDLTASRRLALAARARGLKVLMVRAAARPTPSAAHTRWQVRSLPSRELAAKAPGPPAFEMTLLRTRSGQEGLRYCLEWDRDARQFIPRSFPLHGAATEAVTSLSGALVPFSSDRPGALDERWRYAG